jgi:hypothetical protein
MTGATPGPVVPPVTLAGGVEPPRWRRAAIAARRPLPLLALVEQRAGAAVYGMSTVDPGGRIADRAIMAALGWVAGERLDIRAAAGLIAVVADARGVFRITPHRFLHLPVAARRWCRLAAGDRVLLAAYPQTGLLVVHAPAVLDAVVNRVHAAALGGSDDE